MINNTQAKIYAQLQHKALHVWMDSRITSATTPDRQPALDVESYQAGTVWASPSTMTICWQLTAPDPAGTGT